MPRAIASRDDDGDFGAHVGAGRLEFADPREVFGVAFNAKASRGQSFPHKPADAFERNRVVKCHNSPLLQPRDRSFEIRLNPLVTVITVYKNKGQWLLEVAEVHLRAISGMGTTVSPSPEVFIRNRE